MSEPNEVVVACPCPGTPHAEDTITLYPTVPVQLGAAAFGMLDEGQAANPSELLGHLAPLYLHFGIASWTLVDDKGEELPVNRANIDGYVTWATCAWPVVRAANAIYPTELLRPLAPRRSRPSKPGRTPASTSPIPLNGRKRQTRSAPSSPGVSDGKPSEVRAS